MRASHALPIVAWILALGTAACGPTQGGNGDDDASTDGGRCVEFIAFQSAFADYQTWESFHLDSDFDGGSVHVSGPRTEYLNHRPPAGSTEFPQGTVIVKRFDRDGTTLAMVKRGCGFNSAGANGWEWFDLTQDGGGLPTINWRGVGPRAGETYGGDPTACNVCHRGVTDNDSVPSPALQLRNL